MTCHLWVPHSWHAQRYLINEWVSAQCILRCIDKCGVEKYSVSDKGVLFVTTGIFSQSKLIYRIFFKRNKLLWIISPTSKTWTRTSAFLWWHQMTGWALALEGALAPTPHLVLWRLRLFLQVLRLFLCLHVSWGMQCLCQAHIWAEERPGVTAEGCALVAFTYSQPHPSSGEDSGLPILT